MEKSQVEFLENVKTEAQGDPLRVINILKNAKINCIYRKDLFATGFDFKLCIIKNSNWLKGTLPQKDYIHKSTFFKRFTLHFDNFRDEFIIESNEFGQPRANLENEIRDLEMERSTLEITIEAYRFDFEMRNDAIADQYQEELKKLKIILGNYYAKRDMMENGL